MSSGSERNRDDAGPAAALRDLLWGRTSRLHAQFLRYVVVGGVAAAADFSVYIVLVRLAGIHYLVGNAFGFAVGVLINYLLSIRWVFSHRNVRSRHAELAIFLVIGVLGLGVSELVLFTGVTLLGMNDLVTKVVATGVTLVWNFTVRKGLLFRQRRPERS